MINDAAQLNPRFKAVDAYFTDEGLVLVSSNEAEAQRAYFQKAEGRRQKAVMLTPWIKIQGME